MFGPRRSLFSLVLVATTALTACGDISSNRTGGLTIKLTDAPGDLAEAWVEITEIYLQGGTAEGDGRVTLFEGSTGMIDLLTLAGGKTVDLVKDATVPEGTFSQLRFRIGRALIRTEDEREFSTDAGNLLCPSCQTPSGLKVNLMDGGVKVDGGYNVVVVDFDVSQSFGSERGKSGRWVMHPVMYASDFQLSGAISGTVTLAEDVTIPDCGGSSRDLSAFIPTATSGETVRSGVTAADGSFTISHLVAGSYTLGSAVIEYENEESLSFTASADPSEVAVSSQQTPTADFLVTAVVCTSAPEE